MRYNLLSKATSGKKTISGITFLFLPGSGIPNLFNFNEF